VESPALGVVIGVSNECHRGGLKVLVEHGEGLITTSNHLGRSLVEVGQRVRRGEPIALSGASGVDMVLAFPWNAPHVHFNTWLNGVNIDPFAVDDEVSIWRNYNAPTPCEASDTGDEAAFTPSDWDFDAVRATIEGCRDPVLSERLSAVEEPARQAADTLFYVNYFATRFSLRPCLFRRQYPRRCVLDLPFRRQDYVGIVHLDVS